MNLPSNNLCRSAACGCAILLANTGAFTAEPAKDPSPTVGNAQPLAIVLAPVSAPTGISPVGGTCPRHAPAVLPSLDQILGMPPARPPTRAGKITAIQNLGDHLGRDAIVSLYQFVAARPLPAETDRAGLNWLKNDILNALREQQTPPAGFTQLLIGIYRDSGQDLVMRDYAIQHLVLWYDHGAPNAAERADIRALLTESAAASGPVAGTALLGCHRLSQNDPAFETGAIDQLALQLAKSAGTDNATRLTAIQVCAERRLKAALPAIIPLANTTNCIPLGIAAAAALKSLNDEQPTGVASSASRPFE